MRVAKRRVGAPPVGHVAGHGEDDVVIGQHPRVGLKPAHRAVAADDTMHDADHVIAVAANDWTARIVPAGLIASWPGVPEHRMPAACGTLRLRGHAIRRITITDARGTPRGGWTLGGTIRAPSSPTA